MLVDENFPILADVTQEDIDAGCQQDDANCPAAKAIKRAVLKRFPKLDPTDVTVSVNRAALKIIMLGPNLETETYRSKTPIRLSRFIKKYDETKVAVPTRFRLHFYYNELKVVG